MPATPRPVVVVAGRQRPHELLLLAVSLAWGVAYLVGAPPPDSVAALMQRWQVVVWSALLVVSGVVGLAGCWWRRNIELGLGLELAGMLFGSGALFVFSVAAVHATHRITFGIGMIMVWFAANLWRAAQIGRELRVGVHAWTRRP